MTDRMINPKAIHLARLTDVELPDLVNFDCNDSEMNRFIKEEALEEQERGMNNTFLLYYEGGLAAFCSICSDSIPLSKSERKDEGIIYYKVPAIKIARLGRDVQYKGKGLGAWFIGYIKSIAFELSKTKLGVRFLTLDAYPARVDYYRCLGFVRNEAMIRKDQSTVSMRADIFD